MLRNTTITTLNVNDIDFTDKSYIFTFEPLMSQMVQSIKNIGLINMPILAQKSNKPSYRIISGLKRILALIHLRNTNFTAYVFPDENSQPNIDLFLMNFYENLSIRVLNPVEKSIIINKLLFSFNIPKKDVLNKYLPLMGLGSNNKVLDMYINLNKLEDNFKIAVVENFMSTEAAVQLLNYSKDERQAIYELCTQLKLGKNRQKEFVRLVNDISHIVNKPIDEVINQRLIQRILTSEKYTLSQKISKIREFFRKMRFPIYSEAEEKFNKISKELKLPPHIVLRHSPYFESDKYTMEINFKNKKEFQKSQKILIKIAEENKLDKLESLDK